MYQSYGKVMDPQYLASATFGKAGNEASTPFTSCANFFRTNIYFCKSFLLNIFERKLIFTWYVYSKKYLSNMFILMMAKMPSNQQSNTAICIQTTKIHPIIQLAFDQPTFLYIYLHESYFTFKHHQSDWYWSVKYS